MRARLAEVSTDLLRELVQAFGGTDRRPAEEYSDMTTSALISGWGDSSKE
jgi:hypothetical protein